MNILKSCGELYQISIQSFWCYFREIYHYISFFIPIYIYHLSISKCRFLPFGRPILPSESKCRIMFSFFFGNGLLISSTGGRALIFLPWIPVFLCHNPDLGVIPRHRFLLGDPTTPSFSGCIDILPTTHWQRWSKNQIVFMFRLLGSVYFSLLVY